MRRIAIISTSRADFFLLNTLANELLNSDLIQVDFIATAGLLTEHNFEFLNLMKDHDKVNIIKIYFDINTSTNLSISESISNGITKFSYFFSKNKYETVIVLGDRYELLSIAIPALNERIPITHIHGGEITLGSMDDYYRNAITKMSRVHFTATESSKKRVIQMGENPEMVFNVGSLGIQNITNKRCYSKGELSQLIDFDFEKVYAVATFHPETSSEEDYINNLYVILDSFKEYSSINFLVTHTNKDLHGDKMNKILDEFKSTNIKIIDSLGQYYLSALKHSAFVIGNSSSGIIEAPSLKLQTINLGIRQSGRERAKSVRNCAIQKDQIIKCIDATLQKKEYPKDFFSNPYFKANTAQLITQHLLNLFNNKISIQKGFYDS